MYSCKWHGAGYFTQTDTQAAFTTSGNFSFDVKPVMGPVK